MRSALIALVTLLLACAALERVLSAPPPGMESNPACLRILSPSPTVIPAILHIWSISTAVNALICRCGASFFTAVSRSR